MGAEPLVVVRIVVRFQQRNPGAGAAQQDRGCASRWSRPDYDGVEALVHKLALCLARVRAYCSAVLFVGNWVITRSSMTPGPDEEERTNHQPQTGKAIVAHMLRRQAGVRAGYGPPNRTDLQTAFALVGLEPMTGIEPAYSAWEVF